MIHRQVISDHPWTSTLGLMGEVCAMILNKFEIALGTGGIVRGRCRANVRVKADGTSDGCITRDVTLTFGHPLM